MRKVLVRLATVQEHCLYCLKLRLERLRLEKLTMERLRMGHELWASMKWEHESVPEWKVHGWKVHARLARTMLVQVRTERESISLDSLLEQLIEC